VSGWTVRVEEAGDAPAIARVTAAAFARAAHASGTEAEVVDKLRASGDLAVSLVAQAGSIIGHVAFSPVRITDGVRGWFGLGPVSVAPQWQGRGVGAALVRAGLARLVGNGAAGCVVLGDPAYYGRFGFRYDPALTFPGPPAAYFQRLVLAGAAPAGVVSYAPDFS